MDQPFIIPLACFAMVALLVAIVNTVKTREHELDVRQRLHEAELEHRRKMSELDLELEKIKQG